LCAFCVSLKIVLPAFCLMLSRIAAFHYGYERPHRFLQRLMQFSLKDFCSGAVSLSNGRTQSKKELHMTTVEPKSNVRPATARYSQPANVAAGMDHHSLAKA